MAFIRKQGRIIIALTAAILTALFLAGPIADAEGADFTCYGLPADLPITCSTRGTCVAQDTCRCEFGTGSVCQTYAPATCYGISSADAGVCSGNGMCVANDTCECFPGFNGEACDVPFEGTCYGLDASDPTVCSGNGVCDFTDECICDPDFVGLQCQYNEFSCGGFESWEPEACHERGTCVAQDLCECDPGYKGSDCQFVIEPGLECGSYPAEHEAICNGRGNCFELDECECESGFYGSDCESVVSCFGVDKFREDVCNGKGTCTSNDWCVCATGFLPPDCSCDTSGWCIGDPRDVRWDWTTGLWSVKEYWDVRSQPGSAETIYIDNNGTVQITRAGKVATKAYVGYTENIAGHVEQTGGSLAIGEDMVIGFHGTGTYSQTGGTHTITDNLVLGWENDGTGSYTLAGGSLSIGSDGFVGYYSTGTFNQTGGTHHIGASLYMARFAGSGGVYTLNNGDLTITGDIIDGEGAGEFTISGGTLTVGGTITTDTFTFTGGRLGFGTFNGDLANQGGDLAAGAASVAGNYTQNTGTLEVNIEGRAAGDCQRLQVTGHAALNGGALLLGSAGPYQPADDIGVGETVAWEILHADGGLTWDAGALDITFEAGWLPVSFTHRVYADAGSTGLWLEVTNTGDACPGDPAKTEPGTCGCGVADTDSDGDGTPDCNDNCPNDPGKVEPGICGCGVADTDSDGDGTPNCNDNCPNDPDKLDPGICGCGVADTDSDGDGTPNCNDNCPNDPGKLDPGLCGCGVADTDSDGDGTPNCYDACPNDPEKIEPGVCGCGEAETDSDGDDIEDCIDNCPGDANPNQNDLDNDGVGDVCDSYVNLGLDAFLAYKAKPTKRAPKFQPTDVSLRDDFEEKYFTVKKMETLLNPADIDGEGILDDVSHLVGYQIKRSSGEPKHERRVNVKVMTALGNILVNTKKPDSLLVPSSKALAFPAAPLNPVSIDHFKCYSIKVSKNVCEDEPTRKCKSNDDCPTGICNFGFPKGVQARIADQFGQDKTFHIQSPKKLCTPVDIDDDGIIDPDIHLTCYKVKRAKGELKHVKLRGVYINNRFCLDQLDPGENWLVDTVKEDEFCVPSLIE